MAHYTFHVIRFSQMHWRRRGFWHRVLLPLSWGFGLVSGVRRGLYRLRILPTATAGAPVIVVGNIVVGGGGKTPLVIALVQALRARGFCPGVAARGAGGREPLMVDNAMSWRRCGDEPLLIRRKTGAPVCVCKRRAAAARRLVDGGCNVIVSDDGLQHYELARNMEIAAVNADFGLGNGWLLPAGPLRESPKRLLQCDSVLVNYYPGAAAKKFPQWGCTPVPIPLVVDRLYAAANPQQTAAASFFAGKKTAAAAGIAHPQRFFALLREMGVVLHRTVALADHAALTGGLAAIDADAVIMTEKDAVKYDDDGEARRLFVLSLRAELPPAWVDTVVAKIVQADALGAGRKVG